MGTGEFTAGGNPALDWHHDHIQGGVEILLVALCDRNRDKLLGQLKTCLIWSAYQVTDWLGTSYMFYRARDQ